MNRTRVFTRTWALMALALIILLGAGAAADMALAQSDGDQTQLQNRDQIQNREQGAQGDALRLRIRERIDREDGLQDQERVRLREHLGECKQLGLEDDVLAALFCEQEPLQKQIKTQERVLAMAREGVPVEPFAQKLQEGRRKGANPQVMEQVCTRIEKNLRIAHHYMQRVHEDGVETGNLDAERRRTQQMAMNMWHGLEEGDLEQLRERARLRLRDGSCTTEDVAASAETATQLKEMGIERQRAVRLAGDALQNGYSAQEMRQLGWMIRTAHMHGGPPEDVVGTVEDGIRNQHQLTHMMQQMWQQGWMGPADQHGGHGPMDGSMGSGPGGHHGDDQDQGQGDGSGHGHGGGMQ
ncbi:MAG: hypothetical protein ABIA59_06450 [Candidatus Latescibacterota bacterium]